MCCRLKERIIFTDILYLSLLCCFFPLKTKIPLFNIFFNSQYSPYSHLSWLNFCISYCLLCITVMFSLCSWCLSDLRSYECFLDYSEGQCSSPIPGLYRNSVCCCSLGYSYGDQGRCYECPQEGSGMLNVIQMFLIYCVEQGGVSQNLSSVTNDSFCYKLLKSLLLIGYQQIYHWFLSFVIEKCFVKGPPGPSFIKLVINNKWLKFL